MKKRFSFLLLLCFAAVSGPLSAAESGYGILVGKAASTDGRVYLAHNAYAKGEQMLNIYNRPDPVSGSSCLWFEFPGLCYSDVYLNGRGVGTAVVPSSSECGKAESLRFYRIVDEVAVSASSAAEAAERIASACRESRCGASAAVLLADVGGGWICLLSGEGSAQVIRVPDSATVYVRPAQGKRGLRVDTTFERHHRTDLCRHLTETGDGNPRFLLSNVFCFDSRYDPRKGSGVYAGFPGMSHASQTMWTSGIKSPDCCHRFGTADEARLKHFSDVRNLRRRWPEHFYWRYLHPEHNIDVVDHDLVVFVPKGVSDIYNDHFHVLDDTARGLLYAFWTQGSFEGAADMHIVFSRSSDKGRTWSEPVLLAGSPDLVHPTRRASWQQPMLSRSGRLYCLWNQETTAKDVLSGPMWGCYSDDGGLHWSEPEECPLSLRTDTDPEDLSIPPVWCNWQRPLRLGENGKFFVASSRHGKAAYDKVKSCKVEFWQYENIDEDPEIRDIRISFFSGGRDALDAAAVETEQHFLGSDGNAIEEASIVGLPDGRLFSIMRSSTGYSLWSQSRDGGRTWDRPRVLRTADGKPVLHPRSPCPMYDVMGPEARSGKYVAFVHGAFDFEGTTSYQLRGPLYRIDGVFDPEGEQPVKFTVSGVFIPRESFNSMYSSYTPWEGGGMLWFNDQKYYLFGKKICPETRK